MTQRDSRSGQHGQCGQQPSAGTTDSYETLASAPEITLSTLPSTERQWGRREGVFRVLAGVSGIGGECFSWMGGGSSAVTGLLLI
jgi:hypothetical protein